MTQGASMALTAAVLFGAGAAACKALLPSVHPALLAGLLYVSSGTALSLVVWRRRRGAAPGAPLRGKHLPWLGAAIACGGVAAPVLLMLGLARLPASNASLLLALEAPLTAVIAALVFGETLGRRTAAALLLVTAGACVLGWSGGRVSVSMAGALYTAAACLLWALDNNFSAKLSELDPVMTAALKSLPAGLVNVALALSFGAALPRGPVILAVAVAGTLSYGASLVLYLAALQRLGAGRTALFFSIAPFAGAGLAVLLLQEPLTARLLVAAALAALGAILAATERHEHWHIHREEHEHEHQHDEHHVHEHVGSVPPPLRHAHHHSHAGTAHRHPHFPDLHHRQDH